MANPAAFPENEYRRRIQDVYDRLQAVFEDVDPDVAECQESQGAFTISFADRSRCILSAQPSVRQLWLALASQGTAYHFDWDPAGSRWLDDKGRGIELLAFLEEFLRGKTGLRELSIRA